MVNESGKLIRQIDLANFNPANQSIPFAVVITLVSEPRGS